MDEAAVSLPAQDQHSAVQAEEKTFQFRFSGQTAEYFRIWIVNVALTVLTLGIYSAWATVRTRRYFYAHTRLADVPFVYDARPVPILIGRLIAVFVVAVYVTSEYFFPLAIPFIFIAVAIAIPALVVRSLRFRARYSSWHGARFRFAGSYADAYKYYFFCYFLVLISFGLLYPLVKAWQKQYMVGNHRFGERRFTIESLVNLFYKTYIFAWLGVTGLMVAAMIFMMAGLMTIGIGESEVDGGVAFAFAIAAFMITLYGGLFLVGMYIYSRLTNGMYTHARLDEDFTFDSRLQARQLAGLYVTNTLAIIFTLGLAIPWARIRMARYRASCLSMIGPDDFGRFTSRQSGEERAIGAEVGEVFEVEVGF